VSMQISISSLQTHNVNRCGRSRHLARKLSLRRKRSSPNVFEMAATETITSIILIKLIRVSLGTVRHPRRFKIVVIDIQIKTQQEQESEGILQSPAYHKRKPQRSDEHESGQQQSKLCYSSENRNHLRLNPKRQKPE